MSPVMLLPPLVSRVPLMFITPPLRSASSSVSLPLMFAVSVTLTVMFLSSDSPFSVSVFVVTVVSSFPSPSSLASFIARSPAISPQNLLQILFLVL